MPKFTKTTSKKAGLPPGSIVPITDGKAAAARITVIDYDATSFEERSAQSAEECLPYKGKPSVTWINVDGIQDVTVMEGFGEHFGLHPLVLEDIVDSAQRPKMEDLGDYIFVVLKMLSLDAATGSVKSEQVALIVGADYVLSFQEVPGDVFDPIRERLRSSKGRIRDRGADYLAYALLDAIVDNYFSILEYFGEEMEGVEVGLVSAPTPEMLQTIYVLKRELLFLRKSIWPLRELVNGLLRTESPLIHERTMMYLRDIYDNAIQVMDTVETFREMLGGMRDTYISSVSNRMNEVMKVLTIIATIFIPITFIAGIYGMNFQHMPELSQPWGYFAALGVMGVIGLIMVIYFSRKGWL